MECVQCQKSHENGQMSIFNDGFLWIFHNTKGLFSCMDVTVEGNKRARIHFQIVFHCIDVDR